MLHFGAGSRLPKQTAQQIPYYRGVGNFELPVVYKMKKDRVPTIQNRGDQPISQPFIYELGDGMSARFQLLDALLNGQTTQVDLEKLTASGPCQKPVYNAQALIDSGLYREACAERVCHLDKPD